MTKTHTPRPWRAFTMRDGTRNIIGPDNAFVCTFSHIEGDKREDAEADGSLIASAPDLLAALVGIVEADARARGERPPVSLMQHEAHAERNAALAAARAAIQKAEGKE